MNAANHQAEAPNELIEPEPICPLPREAANKMSAWQMIENGRYQPRRIKGSLLGRELG
jgi:hypothetical protein